MDAAGAAPGRRAASGEAATSTRRPPRAAVILGNDAIVAARPCSAWQLVHACRAAGFDLVMPPTVGDELVAGAYLERLSRTADHAVVACHCPRARALLARCRPEARLPPIRVVAPPVAAARALRLTYGPSILVTYIGDCPAADDPSINARFSPAGFLASLDRQGIVMPTQPNAMPAAEATRWHRYLSVPGGLPALRWLARAPVNRVFRDVNAKDLDAARHAGSRSKVLLDLTECSGCACGAQRARIEECEPPRAAAPIVVAPSGLELGDDRPPTVAAAQPSRPSQAPSSPAVPVVAEIALGTREEPTPAASTPPVRAERPRPLAMAQPQPPRARGALVLALLPLAVLAVAAALGAGVYAVASRGVRSATASGESPAWGDTTRRADTRPAMPTIPAEARRETTTVSPATPMAPADTVSRLSSPASASKPASAEMTADSVIPRRPSRRPRLEVVPGWLPQGHRTFTPIDTTRARKRDSSSTAPPKRDTIPRT